VRLSFDGIRENLADAFNDLASTELSDEQREIMRWMRQIVGGLLAAYDPRDQPGDCNMLADEVELLPIPGEEDEEDIESFRRHNRITKRRVLKATEKAAHEEDPLSSTDEYHEALDEDDD
jgi:hypothetical protein